MFNVELLIWEAASADIYMLIRIIFACLVRSCINLSIIALYICKGESRFAPTAFVSTRD